MSGLVKNLACQGGEEPHRNERETVVAERRCQTGGNQTTFSRADLRSWIFTSNPHLCGNATQLKIDFLPERRRVQTELQGSEGAGGTKDPGGGGRLFSSLPHEEGRGGPELLCGQMHLRVYDRLARRKSADCQQRAAWLPMIAHSLMKTHTQPVLGGVPLNTQS